MYKSKHKCRKVHIQKFIIYKLLFYGVFIIYKGSGIKTIKPDAIPKAFSLFQNPIP